VIKRIFSVTGDSICDPGIAYRVFSDHTLKQGSLPVSSVALKCLHLPEKEVVYLEDIIIMPGSLK